MSKHTPGPWKIGSNGFSTYVYDKGSKLVANTNDGRQTRNVEEKQANALLIAAAPDLLSSLEELFNLLEAHQDDAGWYLSGHHKRARAAIARATGQKAGDA